MKPSRPSVQDCLIKKLPTSGPIGPPGLGQMSPMLLVAHSDLQSLPVGIN